MGALVMDNFEEDKVFCFADNSADKVGKIYKGRKVISLEELMEIHDQYNVLVTTLYKSSLEIQKDLNKLCIKSYILYPQG